MSLSVYRDEGAGPSVEVRAIYDDKLTEGGEKRKGKGRERMAFVECRAVYRYLK